MEVAFSIAGIFGISMLIGGIVLTVITIGRMVSGKIALPRWAKVLLCIGMIAMVVILFLGMLPTHLVEVENPFVETHSNVVFPDSSISTEATR